MGEKLEPARIYRPRRLRPVSREHREENDSRFHKTLAELADSEQGEDEARRESSGEATADQGSEERPSTRNETPSSVGRNLDVRT